MSLPNVIDREKAAWFIEVNLYVNWLCWTDLSAAQSPNYPFKSASLWQPSGRDWVKLNIRKIWKQIFEKVFERQSSVVREGERREFENPSLLSLARLN